MDGRWHQVAFVLDRNPVDELGNKIAGSQLRIYVDGRLDGATTVSYTFPQRTANFRFGCDAALWGGIGGNNGAQCFTGRMGLVAASPSAVTGTGLQGSFRRDIKSTAPRSVEGLDISEGLNALEGLAELNLPEGRNESEELEAPESLEGTEPAETPGQPGAPGASEGPADTDASEEPAER